MIIIRKKIGREAPAIRLNKTSRSLLVIKPRLRIKTISAGIVFVNGIGIIIINPIATTTNPMGM